VDEEIAHGIGNEVHIAVTAIVGELCIEIAFGFLPGNNVEGVLLILILIEGAGIEAALAEGRIRWSIRIGGAIRVEAGVRGVEWATAKAPDVAGLPWIVGNLIAGLAEPRKGDHPHGWIKHGGCIGEESRLLGMIVNGVEGRYRIVQAEAGAEV